MAKKAAISLDAGELQQIRSFYEQERIQLAARLQHVDQVIARLGGASAPISGSAPTVVVAPAPAVPKKRGPGRPRKTEASVEVKSAKKAGRPRKRGPKSVWGNFILRRLRQCDRPLSYSELVRDAMVLNNLPAEKEKNAKASVLNAAFRLRSTLGKIDTVGLPGKKEKFLVLKSWMNGDVGLKAPYDKLLASVANKPMDDRGRQPRRPSSASGTESKVKARMKSADAKTAAKQAPARKPSAKKTSAKPAAKKTQARKPAVKKAAAKPAAKKATAKPASKKAPGRKPASKKTAAKKA